MRGIHRIPVNSPHKGPVTRKMFPFDDVVIASVSHSQKQWGKVLKEGTNVADVSWEKLILRLLRYFHHWNGIILSENPFIKYSTLIWWCHQMETFTALLALCARNSPVTGEFSVQRPVTRGLGVSFDLRLNKRLRKHLPGWWFETPSRPLWRHCNAIVF